MLAFRQHTRLNFKLPSAGRMIVVSNGATECSVANGPGVSMGETERILESENSDHIAQSPTTGSDWSRPFLVTTIIWFRDLLLSVLIAVLVILFLYRPVKVEGTSMMPSLFDQERLFINQFSYKFRLGDIRRGDTVVFWYPEDTTKSYIKRVIGLPGDTVAVTDGYVVVNGKRLEENYVPPYYRDYQEYTSRVVPENEYFVLGDHRISSNDSRSWGFVPRRYIYGKAVFVFWPPDRVGTVH